METIHIVVSEVQSFNAYQGYAYCDTAHFVVLLAHCHNVNVLFFYLEVKRM